VSRFLSLAFVLVLVGVGATSGSAAHTAKRVPLTLSIAGKGSVRLTDGRRIACSSSCRTTVLVRRGATVGLAARAGTGWAFSYWAGACASSPGSACRLLLRHAARATVKFAPPGSTRANPVPLGRPARVNSSWIVTVGPADLDATAELLGIAGNAPPRAGAQYAMVYLTATFTGGGPGSLANAAAFYAIGAHGAAYEGCDQALPPPALHPSDVVYAGQTIGGNVCYEIASKDASSLVLFAGYYEPFDQSEHKVWFRLRR
jgi:hypothetical protein